MATTSRQRPRSRAAGRGAVTAETAVVLPVLIAVAIGLAWVVSLGVAHVRVVDAARETARALARDEQPAAALSLGRRVAPQGATISVQERTGTLVVTVSAEVRGPGGLFRFLPGVEVDAEAVAAKEQG